MYMQNEEKIRQLQEKLELADQKLQQSLKKAEALPTVEAELQQRLEALSKAEELHGSAEERVSRVEQKLMDNEAELSRVGVVMPCIPYTVLLLFSAELSISKGGGAPFKSCLLYTGLHLFLFYICLAHSIHHWKIKQENLSYQLHCSTNGRHIKIPEMLILFINV